MMIVIGDMCESGRRFETRRKENIRNVKTCPSGASIAKHVWKFLPRCIDFDNSLMIGKDSVRTRKTLASWHMRSVMRTK